MATPPPPNNPHSDEKPPRRPVSPPVSADAPLLQTTEAGPRPLSDRQKAKQAEGRPENRHIGGGRVYEAPPIRPPYMGEPSQSPTAPRQNKNVRVVRRDADTTRVRRTLPAAKDTPRTNRRRMNYPRLFLGWAFAAFVFEIAAAALWSPRLWVKSVSVEGNKTVPTSRLLARLHIGPRDNVVRLPVGKLQADVQAEPSVEWAEVKRTLPPGVQVFVRERTPWASVQVGGVSYTIDRNLVPFRKHQTPEPRLPRLVLSGAANSAAPPVLGKPMTAPGLPDVSRCLAWSAEQTDFPLESVEIDPQGKLCLNKVGGLPVRLGSGVDLDKKLQTFAALLATRPELRNEQTLGSIEEINLLAFDAPAVKWRVASNPAGSGGFVAPLVSPLGSSPLSAPVSPAPPGGEIVP